MTTEVKDTIEQLGRSFEQFKKANDEARTAMQKEFAENLNNAVGDLQEKLDQSVAAFTRSGGVRDAQDQKEAAIEALNNFAQKGHQGYFADALEEKAGYDITTDANGKYGVPTIIDAMVSRQVREYSSLRPLITIKTIGTTAYNGILSLNDATVGNVAELGTRTATNANTFIKKTINVHEQYANPTVTLQMLEDVQFNAEDELLYAVGEAFGALESSDWVNGTGDGNYKATGFLTVTKNDITDGSLGAHDKLNTVDGVGDLAIVGDDIINLQDALPAVFAKNGSFGMGRKTQNRVRKLKDGTTGEYLWQPSYQAGVPATLAGSPVHIIPEISSAVTANATPIVFADWKNFYYGVDRVGLSLLRDPFKTEGSVVFKFRKRQGGGLWNGRAGVALKMIDQA